MRLWRYIVSRLNRSRKGVPAYWWRPANPFRRNFGDEVTPVVINELIGYRCHWTRLADCHIVGAGSILDIVRDYNPKNHRLHVWGSGYIEDSELNISDDAVQFTLVRGALTKERLPSDSHSIPLGDPGLLVSRVFQKLDTEDKIGIVPHIRDRKHLFIETLHRDSRFFVIDPYWSPKKVAQSITRCKIVFSSSLHGLIFSDSYGVPNYRLKLSRLEGDDYKFIDYYSSTGQKNRSFDAESIQRVFEYTDTVDDLIKNYMPVSQLEELQKTIIDSFPHSAVVK